MTDITPEHEVNMRIACHSLIAARDTPMSNVDRQFYGRATRNDYADVVRPELVLMLLDMGNQMTQAVEKIDALVKAAGFDNLEQALKAIERIGKLLHNAD